MEEARIIKYVPEDLQIIEYDINEAYIAEAEDRDKDFKLTPGDKKGYDVLMGFLAIRRKIRIAIEARRKANNEGAKAFIEANNKWGKELYALNDPGEERLRAIRQVEDDRVNAIEKVRVDAIQKKIQQIKGKSFGLSTLTADQLKTLIKDIEGTPLEKEEFEEFTGEAQATAYNALIAIKSALETRERLDKQEATQKAEAERLEKIRVDQEAAQKKIDAAQAEIDEATKKLQKERDKIEEEKQAEQDRIAKAQEAERIRKEREDFKKMALEEAARKVKEAQEQAELDVLARTKEEAEDYALQETMKTDKEKLFTFANSLTKIIFPPVDSEAAKNILTWVSNSLQELQEIIKERAENL